jgi:predicted GTPase
VDYAEILRLAEVENDVILWDGGNNDLPFYRPDLHICIADPHRPGHGMSYWPGEANLRRADVVIVSKVDTAEPEGIARVLETVAAINPTATVIQAGLEITLSDPAAVAGKRVLVIEDGPTLTHGGMAYGAGTVAARDHGAAELIDPRPFAVGSIRDVFERYPHMGALLPAMGYGDSQIEELLATIVAAQPDVILVGTPADIGRLIELPAPSIRVSYEYVDRSSLTLEETLAGLG